MAAKPKITTGANDRPRDETIAETGPGQPDDSGRLPDIDQDASRRLQSQLEKEVSERQRQPEPAVGRSNPDQVPPGTPGAGEDVCRRCSGTGRVAGRSCPDCGGTGRVMVPVGGA